MNRKIHECNDWWIEKWNPSIIKISYIRCTDERKRQWNEPPNSLPKRMWRKKNLHYWNDEDEIYVSAVRIYSRIHMCIFFVWCMNGCKKSSSNTSYAVHGTMTGVIVFQSAVKAHFFSIRSLASVLLGIELYRCVCIIVRPRGKERQRCCRGSFGFMCFKRKHFRSPNQSHRHIVFSNFYLLSIHSYTPLQHNRTFKPF